MKKNMIAALAAAALMLALSACSGSTQSTESAQSSEPASTGQTASVSEPASSSSEAQAEQSGEWAQNEYTQGVYYSNGSEATLTMYDQPGGGNEVGAIPAMESAVVLKQENGWAYAAGGGRIGWVDASALTQNEGMGTLIIPDFLDGAQQKLFVEAVGLFDCYSTQVAGQRGVVDRDDSVNTGTFWGLRDIQFRTADELRAALTSVFTEEYAKASFLPDGVDSQYFAQEVNGALYMGSADRGAFFTPVRAYELTSQTESAMEFNAVFSMTDTAGTQWEARVPMKLELTDAGWRFSAFTTGRDDITWMNAMPEGFDIWNMQ